MKRFDYIFIVVCSFFALAGCSNKAETEKSHDQGDLKTLSISDRWVSSAKVDTANILRLTIHAGDQYQFITDGHRDHKPVWSKDGDRITFFRATGQTDAKPFHDYRTHICVVNSDGTDLRELTDATHPNVNPTWTRDGSNKIIFNRLSKSPFGEARFFIISPDASFNDTVLVSDPNYFEWAESGMKDGRIFMFRINKARYIVNYILPSTWFKSQSSFLLDPESREYYPIKRPNKFPTHKLSMSPSESKLVYMKDLDGKLHTYNDAVIAYAEFDEKNREVKNEVVISAKDKNHIDMYPRWSPDERFIIYSSSRGRSMWDMRQYVYSLNSGETHLIPNGELILDMYPCFEDLPK
jgi:Tol biopolymer transport system component